MKINFCSFFMLIGLGSINLNEALKASNAIPNAIPAVPVFKKIQQEDQLADQRQPPKEKSKKIIEDEICLFFIGPEDKSNILYICQINWGDKIKEIAHITNDNSLENDYTKLSQWASQIKENGIKKDSLAINTSIAIKRVAFFTSVFGRSKKKEDALNKLDQFAKLYQFKVKKEKELRLNTLKIIFEKISKQIIEDVFTILLAASKRENAKYIPSPMEFISDRDQNNNLGKTNFELNWDSKNDKYWKGLIQKWFYRGHLDNFATNDEKEIELLNCFMDRLIKNRDQKSENKKERKNANIDSTNPSQMGHQPDEPSNSFSPLAKQIQIPRKNKRPASHYCQNQASNNAQIEAIHIDRGNQQTPTLADRIIENKQILSSKQNPTFSHDPNEKNPTSSHHSSQQSESSIDAQDERRQIDMGNNPTSPHHSSQQSPTFALHSSQQSPTFALHSSQQSESSIDYQVKTNQIDMGNNPTFAHCSREQNKSSIDCQFKLSQIDMRENSLVFSLHSSQQSQIDTGRNNPTFAQHSSERSQALSNAQIEIIQAYDIEMQINQSKTIIDIAKESPKQVAINKPKDSFFQRICCCLAPKRPKAM